MKIVTEELSKEEFNDSYYPKIDITNKNRYDYFRYKGRDFAYDKNRNIVIHLFKDEDEIDLLGKTAPWRELDSIGLKAENWKNINIRKEYLDEYIFDLEEDGSMLANDFINNELHLYNKDNIDEEYIATNNELEVEPITEAPPEGPTPGTESAISNLLITAINDEWDAISKYNDVLTALDQENMTEMKQTILDILNEENLHVGQLQALLKTISPNAASIEQGQLEGEEQLH